MNSYIAGLHLSHAQGVESIVATSTVAMMIMFARDGSRNMKNAHKEGGEIKSLPTTFIGRFVTPLHALAVTVVPVTYLAGVLSNRMVQPAWYARTAFDVGDLSVGALAWIRTGAAAVAWIGGVWLQRACLRALGKQFHFIGTRDKAQVVSTGPYRIVRHPLYSAVLGQLAVLSIAYWSWIPLVSLGITLGAFAVKIPIEESLIDNDLAMGTAYAEYKKKVPYRLIPYVW
ncbi:hypothetical protein D9757_008176 [Collybiopsis confluens]|uniref:Protein-S-isoprenylcysteine O-methyltransferase n=1 Tax=Collybiopsis confluens TaxID=2823264 RepID=A0A8H5M5I4_9AGAR|nr:hypothetical protein D9757_008176 [Collybiopsis confluens]